MKAVVQRVTRASVTVGGEQISAIGRGICILLGISLEDSQKELEHINLSGAEGNDWSVPFLFGISGPDPVSSRRNTCQVIITG